MELKIVQTDPELIHLALVGELDMAGEQAVEQEFMDRMDNDPKPTIVDLTDVSFVASMGIRMLLRGAKALAAGGVKMVLLNPQPMVSEILQIAEMNQIIPIADDQAEALRLLKAE